MSLIITPAALSRGNVYIAYVSAASRLDDSAPRSDTAIVHSLAYAAQAAEQAILMAMSDRWRDENAGRCAHGHDRQPRAGLYRVWFRSFGHFSWQDIWPALGVAWENSPLKFHEHVVRVVEWDEIDPFARVEVDPRIES